MDNSKQTSELVPAPSNSVRMGQGYNSLAGADVSTDLSYCVERTSLESLGASTGERLLLWVSSAKNELELRESVSRSLSKMSSASIGNTSSSSNGISASFDYTGTRSSAAIFKSKSVYVIIRARKEFSPEVLRDFKVNNDARVYFKAHPQDFLSKCGDRFVSGVVKGAEVAAVLRCDADSEEQKNTISDEIKKKGGYLMFQGNGSGQQLIDQVRSETHDRCVIEVAADGGQGTYNVSNPDGFTASALTYIGSAAPGTARPIEYET